MALDRQRVDGFGGGRVGRIDDDALEPVHDQRVAGDRDDLDRFTRYRDDRHVLRAGRELVADQRKGRSEEHTSELQSLLRSSYAVFCLKKTKHTELDRIPSRTTN